MIERIGSVLIGYVCGHLIAGFLVAKWKGVDLRTVGSGNVGATNTLRSLGKAMGLIALLCDILKVFAACGIAWLLFGARMGEDYRLLFFYAGLGAVLGHDYPVYMPKKGGKGVAATAGMALIAAFVACPLSALIFFVVVGVTRYVSLGSILMELAFLIQVVVMGQLGWLHMSQGALIEAYVITAFLVALGIAKHRENIKRLLNKTENKIF